MCPFPVHPPINQEGNNRPQSTCLGPMMSTEVPMSGALCFLDNCHQVCWVVWMANILHQLGVALNHLPAGADRRVSQAVLFSADQLQVTQQSLAASFRQRLDGRAWRNGRADPHDSPGVPSKGFVPKGVSPKAGSQKEAPQKGVNNLGVRLNGF